MGLGKGKTAKRHRYVNAGSNQGTKPQRTADASC